jgi:hypothetical protein
MLNPSLPSSSHHLKNLQGRMKIMQHFTVPFDPNSCHFPPPLFSSNITRTTLLPTTTFPSHPQKPTLKVTVFLRFILSFLRTEDAKTKYS